VLRLGPLGRRRASEARRLSGAERETEWHTAEQATYPLGHLNRPPDRPTSTAPWPWPPPAHPPGYAGATTPGPGPGPSPGDGGPIPSMPLAAAYSAIVVVACSLVADRVLLDQVRGHLSVVGLVVLSTVVGYGPMVAFLAWASRHWGTKSFARDYGFRFRPVDAGWGPLIWIAAIGAEVAVGTAVLVTKIPMKSNTVGLNRLRGNHDVLLAVAISAVIAAPFVEELVFRGLIVRSFLSAMPYWLAIALQAALFGLSHIGPERGSGNVGLVIVLTAVGAVLGSAAYLLRRIGPTIVAHAVLNTFSLILAVWYLKR
jgi:uncharacterized protein